MMALRIVQVMCILFAVPQSVAIIAETIAISSAIGATVSLFSMGTSIAAVAKKYGVHVTIGIEVENWTKYQLQYPTLRPKAGQVDIPPHTINPGEKGSVSVRKSIGKNYGSYGTVSWLIKDKNRRLVVMWEVPYSYDQYVNYLAVGTTREGVTQNAPGDTWYEQMYYGDPSHDLSFIRQKFDDGVSPIIYRDDDFEVVGTMGTIQNTVVKIIFTARKRNDLARPMWILLTNNGTMLTE